MANGFATQLQQACEQFDLALDPGQQQQLVAYLLLLGKWNQAYNLTSIAIDAWVSELLLDALLAAPLLDKSPILDVGSGAGLPAVPLAIARPDLAFDALDSNGKKTRFIKQVAIDLQIPKLNVIQSRVEDFTAPSGYALIVSRAFAELNTFLTSTQHLLAEKGAWLAWKGENLDAELAKVSLAVEVTKRRIVELPNRPGQRYLIRIEPQHIT